MRQTVIVSAARTPFGKFGGALSSVAATDLGAHAIRAALDRIELDPGEVDYAYLGMVVQAGAGQIPSRQATIGAGLPTRVPSDTINKVCASGLRAVNLADMLIRLGEADCVVAGGMENMSRAPFLLEGARWGYKMGNQEVVDAVVHDGLWCSFGDCHMGEYGTTVAREFGIDRESMDRWSLRSHQRAIEAIDSGIMAEEIAPLEVQGRRGKVTTVDTDEAPRRDTSLEKLQALRPAFQEDGLVTAGNAPGLNDGAGALVLMSREKAESLGLEPLAEIVSTGQVSEDPPYLHTVPYKAGRQAIERAGLHDDDLELIEINEAFAAVTLTSAKLAGWEHEKINVNGGAVALGHPIGATGARILMTLMYALRRGNGGYGLATICSGGGQGEATIIKVS